MNKQTTIIELNENTSFEDAYFQSLIESTSELYNEEAAKDFALANWSQLNDNSKNMFDWVFGRESRLKGWKTRKIDDSYGHKLDMMELERDGCSELLPS